MAGTETQGSLRMGIGRNAQVRERVDWEDRPV